MKVILCEDIDNLGGMGATVKVTDGYARNYLLPRKLAVQADSASARQIEHELQIIKKREEKKRAELAQVVKEIEKLTVEIRVRAGEEDKIFGSVTAANIAEKLAELGHEVDKKKIKLAEPIKSLGIFTVPVRLMTDLEAQVKVWVTSLAEQTAEPAQEAEEVVEEVAAEEA